MSDIISAAAMRCKTMADGSLRIEVEVEPRDAQQAFAMFGRPGAPMALAALVQGYAAKPDTEPSPEPEKPKGGPLARLAGQWCQMPEFHRWIGIKHSDALNHVIVLETGVIDFKDPETKADLAAKVVRHVCMVDSRAKLDSDPDARRLFNEYFREPFSAWLETQA